MVTFCALMEMFEASYLSLAEVPGNGKELPERAAVREKACAAVYHLEELAERISAEMMELANHMQVCDAVFAANYIRRNGGNKK